MTGVQLRPYQVDLVDRASAALAKASRVLVQAPTGAGKTALASHMVGGAAKRGRRVIFLVHRVELLRQVSEAFERQGITHGFIAAGMPFNPHHQVYIGSIGTVGRRLDALPGFDLAVVDECHHSIAKSWADVLASLAPRWTIGLSATPCRLDGRGLGEHFDTIVKGPAVADLIAGGFLSPFRVFAPTTLDLEGIRTVAGDYNRGDVAAAADKPAIIGDAVAHYQALTPGKRAVAFCVSVAHAEHVTAQFQAAGISAAAIDGTMASDARAAALADFEAGRTLVLASVDLVSEGFDLPAIEAAILLRPTKSLSLYLQQVGRVLRPAPGKSEAVILDHVGNTQRHGFPDDPREWSLDGVAKRSRAGSDAMPVRTCPACYRVHRPAPVCPACGHSYVGEGRQLEEREGTLSEVVRLTPAEREAAKRVAADARKAEERGATLSELIAIGKARGYANAYAWASHRYAGKQSVKARYA
jgi:DNA repair protein RadD